MEDERYINQPLSSNSTYAVSSSSYLVHASREWKNHKYIRKEGDRYIYETKSSGSKPSRKTNVTGDGKGVYIRGTQEIEDWNGIKTIVRHPGNKQKYDGGPVNPNGVRTIYFKSSTGKDAIRENLHQLISNLDFTGASQKEIAEATKSLFSEDNIKAISRMAYYGNKNQTSMKTEQGSIGGVPYNLNTFLGALVGLRFLELDDGNTLFSLIPRNTELRKELDEKVSKIFNDGLFIENDQERASYVMDKVKSESRTDLAWFDEIHKRPLEITHASSSGNYLVHYGTPRHSGRYPYGSGDRPYQDLEGTPAYAKLVGKVSEGVKRIKEGQAARAKKKQLKAARDAKALKARQKAAEEEKIKREQERKEAEERTLAEKKSQLVKTGSAQDILDNRELFSTQELTEIRSRLEELNRFKQMSDREKKPSSQEPDSDKSSYPQQSNQPNQQSQNQKNQQSQSSEPAKKSFTEKLSNVSSKVASVADAAKSFRTSASNLIDTYNFVAGFVNNNSTSPKIKQLPLITDPNKKPATDFIQSIVKASAGEASLTDIMKNWDDDMMKKASSVAQNLNTVTSAVGNLRSSDKKSKNN